MSRHLPTVPNLEHLKKQAKKRLRRLQREDPESRLADAQRALAGDYGFASWEALKAHVDAQSAAGGDRGGDGRQVAAAAAEPPSGPLFPRFTPQARQALFFARYEAAEAGRRFIEPRDVLLGVIRSAAGAMREAFDRASLTLEHARAAVSSGAHDVPVGTEVEIPFRSEAVETFRSAGAAADRLGHRDIGLPHLVLALLDQPGAAGALLASSALSRDVLVQIATSANSDDRLR
jgi:hypothetical protein